MKDFETYIKYLTGIEVKIEDVNKLDYGKMQNYFKQEYDFKKADLFGKEVIFALRKYDDNFTIEQYLKHVEIFNKFFNAVIVLVLSKLESYNRIRMIHKKVPFIVPFKQMYIPQMFVSLTELNSTVRKHSKTLSPAAQCLLLYHLQVQSLEQYIFKDIVIKLHEVYTKMTISRIANELQEKDICIVEGTKEKKLVFNYKGLTLWQKVENYLTTPIIKKVYIKDDINDIKLYKAGVSALSEYGNIADDLTTNYAIYHKRFKKQRDKKSIMSSNQSIKSIPVELWKYEPGILSYNGVVDKLSLYLSMKDNDNPRIEMDLEQLIRDIKW